MSSANYQCASHVLLSYIYQGSFDAATYGTSSDFCDWAGDELFGTTLSKIKANKSKVGGGFNAFLMYTGSGTQDMLSFSYHPYGSVSVDKSSAIKAITDGNGCYSLKGAVYTVYSDAACTDRIGTITTDKSGDGRLDEVPIGKAYVKETKTPEGYAVDGTVYEVNVEADQTAKVNGGSVKDTPQSNKLDLMLVKLDADTVAVHEDISDEGQTVTVDSLDTPETPGTPYDKTGATAPDAGDNALSVLCLAGAALLGAGAATLGCTFARRKKDGGNADETTDGDNDEEVEE